MPQIVYVTRHSSDIPFGFKLQGGADFSIPLSILQVTPGSVSAHAGLQSGDRILQINDVDTSQLDHNKAKMEIYRAGNEVKLLVER
jgi:PDZ and LIM domain protein 5/6/7